MENKPTTPAVISLDKPTNEPEQPTKKPTNANTAMVKVQSSGVSSFDKWDDEVAILARANMLWKSGLTNYDKPEDVALVMIWSKDNNFPIVNALSHSYVINNKHAVDSHIARALIDNAGIIYETVEDMVPIYEYQSFQKVIYSQEDVDRTPDDFVIFYSAELIKAASASGKLKDGVTPDGKVGLLRIPQPVDYRTHIRFTRWHSTPEGPYKRIEDAIFLYSEAVGAGLQDKSNWKNWPKDCMYSRAFTRGGRRIGEDAMMGVYTKLELVDSGYIDAVDITHDEL